MLRALSILVCFLTIGCSHKQPGNLPEEKPTTRPSAVTERLDEHPITAGARSAPIIEGSTPLAYICTSGGLVRVMDLTTNTQLASGVAPRNSMVRVDDRRGVMIDQQILAAGPLPAVHRYGIFLDPDQTENMFRNSRIGPAAGR